MTAIVPIDQAARNLPAAARARMQAGQVVGSNFTDNVAEGFPRLSIKGKVFRARISGQETPLIDPNTRQPIPYLDCVLVNASRQLAKNFYARGFEEGDLNPPDCWSLDSVRPDASVPNKINATCADCPMNVFGSRTTPSGKAAKACSDSRRVAIILPHELGHDSPRTFMMKVPQSSLKNLKAHAELLKRYGMDINVAITRIAFDYNEAYPKLLFNFVRTLDDASYAKVIDIADSSYVASMLMAPDFDNAPSVHPVQTESVAGMVQQGPVLADDPIAPIVAAAQPNLSQPIHPQPMPDLHATGMGSFNIPPQTAQAQSPVTATAPAGNIINLPDGRLYDMSTGKYVEPPAKKVEMDAATIKLPDGRYYSTNTQQFVTGPEVGAPAAMLGKAAEAAAMQPNEPTKRKRRTPAEMEAARAEEALKAQRQQPAEQMQAPPTTNGHAAQEPVSTEPVTGEAAIEAADADLDNVLADLLPDLK